MQKVSLELSKRSSPDHLTVAPFARSRTLATQDVTQDKHLFSVARDQTALTTNLALEIHMYDYLEVIIVRYKQQYSMSS